MDDARRLESMMNVHLDDIFTAEHAAWLLPGPDDEWMDWLVRSGLVEPDGSVIWSKVIDRLSVRDQNAMENRTDELS